jgi:hypothetical protein
MHKNATKCNERIGKWCKNKHGASKIIDTFETYQGSQRAGHSPRARTYCSTSTTRHSSFLAPSPSSKGINDKARDHSLKSRTPGTRRAYPARISSVTSRECAWRMHGGNPLPWASRRHHYLDRRGKYGWHRLVTSHQRGAQAGVKDNTARSPVRLLHRPKHYNTCTTCISAPVVSP